MSRENSSQQGESDAIAIETTDSSTGNRSVYKPLRKSDAIAIETPGSSSGNGNGFKPPRPKFWRARICGYWERGQCSNGDKCWYAYGQSELQLHDASFAADPRLNSTPIPAQPLSAPVIDSSKSNAATSRPTPAQHRSVPVIGSSKTSAATSHPIPAQSRFVPVIRSSKTSATTATGVCASNFLPASAGVRPRESRYFPEGKKIVGIYADDGCS